MKQLLLPLFGILLFAGCEKEQLSPVEQGQDPTALEFRSKDLDCEQPACVAVTGLIADVTALIAAGDIGFGPGQSILSQLNSIKKKLEEGQTAEAQAKLADLITHLEGLAADGTVETTIITDLIAKVTAADCQIDPSGADCFPYPTVVLNGKTWLAQNLNIEVPGSWCYGNDAANCETYGRLYTWAAAKTACEQLGNGWHLPTLMDWDDMVAVNGGFGTGGYTQLIDGGSSGFNARLGGYRSSNGSFYGLGVYGRYWSATEFDSDIALLYDFLRDSGKLIRTVNLKSDGLSCRCVQD